ncbi:MAG: acetylornithine deacetylase [Persicimonas sp.]
MTTLLDRTLGHLEELVARDTQNPPREVAKSGIIDYVRGALPDFDLDFADHGDGCLSLLAVRGEPRLLFNFHLDTVPAADGWQTDPFELTVDDGRAVGLGACDIKGASACMLAAVEQSDGDVALLFTTDEEAGQSRCVRRFVERSLAFDAVLVAEPTGGRAVVAHRGIATARGRFEGVAGHASERRALSDSALHRAVRWAEAALAFAESHEETTYQELSGVRFNLGRLEGGVKPNVIAPSATVRFGCRPLPIQDPEALLADFQALPPGESCVTWETGFVGPTLPADGDAEPARRVAARLGLEPGEAVDFWTEAALFSEAGFPAIVYGPGEIAQAHTAGEWVALDQLDRVCHTYHRLIETSGTS